MIDSRVKSGFLPGLIYSLVVTDGSFQARRQDESLFVLVLIDQLLEGSKQLLSLGNLEVAGELDESAAVEELEEAVH